MQELIKVSPSKVGEDLIQTVNARDLHRFLESGQDFSDWIKARVDQYGFEDGQDFTVILGKSTGGRPSKEYHISLGMAKELAMMERNAQGRIVRQYFIECEKKLQQQPVVALDDPHQLRAALLGYTEKVIKLQAKIEEDAPKVAGYEQAINADGLFTRRDVAKHLQVKQREFNNHLHKMGHWTTKGVPTARALHLDFAVMKEFVDSQNIIRNHPLITPKGEHFYRTRMLRGEFDRFLDTGNPRRLNQGRAA